MRKLRIALTKGRLEKQTMELFERMGLDCTELREKGRRLILPVGDYEVVLAKAADVITYVEHRRGRQRHHCGKRQKLLRGL